MPKTGTLAVVALLLGIALAFLPQLAMAAEPYVTQGDCDGYPRIDVKTAPDTCLGLVATQLGFARGVMSIGDDIYVTDMGGWQRGVTCRLLRLGDKGRAVPVVLLRDLGEPASLAPRTQWGDLSRHGRQGPFASIRARPIPQLRLRAMW